MIPYGFGDPITSFENPYRQTDPDTPYLTMTPSSFGGWSTSSRRAFAFGSHDESFLRSCTTRASFLYIHIKMHPVFLAYPFLTNHLL